MKKKMTMTMVAVLMLGFMFVLSGCGKKEEQASVNTAETKDNTVVNGETEDNGSDKSGNVSCGIYPDVKTVEDIPMGYFIDGKQEYLCMIPMPLDYIVAAGYTPDGVVDETLDEAPGTTDLRFAIDKGLKEQEYAIYNIRIRGVDGTELYCSINSSERISLENMKERSKSYKELGTEQHPAINYEVEDEYDTADVHLCYKLNENFILLIKYEGPLADKVGNDQLAQNLYDLIEVIE